MNALPLEDIEIWIPGVMPGTSVDVKKTGTTFYIALSSAGSDGYMQLAYLIGHEMSINVCESGAVRLFIYHDTGAASVQLRTEEDAQRVAETFGLTIMREEAA